MLNGAETRQPCRIASREDAERLVGEVVGTIQVLDRLLAAESAEVRVGRIGRGLAEAARKAELGGVYLLKLEAVKANAIALARFAPAAVEHLKTAHAQFGRTVEENRMVLATARAVSESLLKGVSDEMSRAARPQTYAPPGARAARAMASEALVVSRSL